MNWKWQIFLASAVSFIFTACGSGSGSSAFNLESSFEVQLAKTDYTYSKRDSILKIAPPVCKETSLGSLKWEKAAPDTSEAEFYLSKTTAYLVQKKDTTRYDFSGKNFPKGTLTKVKSNKTIRLAESVKDKQIISVFQYEGSCFLKDVYSQFIKGNDALTFVDSSLTALYMAFKPSTETEVDTTQMLADIRAVDCKELSLYDGLVSLKLENLESSKGKVNVSYKKKSCPLDFKIRLAYNESDCRAAYSEFKDSGEKNFNFDDYKLDIEFDEYCLAELILNLKKDEEIPLKKMKAENPRAQAKEWVKMIFPF